MRELVFSVHRATLLRHNMKRSFSQSLPHDDHFITSVRRLSVHINGRQMSV